MSGIGRTRSNARILKDDEINSVKKVVKNIETPEENKNNLITDKKNSYSNKKSISETQNFDEDEKELKETKNKPSINIIEDYFMDEMLSGTDNIKNSKPPDDKPINEIQNSDEDKKELEKMLKTDDKDLPEVVDKGLVEKILKDDQLMDLSLNFRKRPLPAETFITEFTDRVKTLKVKNNDFNNLNDPIQTIKKNVNLIKTSNNDLETLKSSLEETSKAISKLNENSNFSDSKSLSIRKDLINELRNCEKHIKAQMNSKGNLLQYLDPKSMGKIFCKYMAIDIKNLSNQNTGAAEKMELVEKMQNKVVVLMKDKINKGEDITKDENIRILSASLNDMKREIFDDLINSAKGREYLVKEGFNNIVEGIDFKKFSSEKIKNAITLKLENYDKFNDFNWAFSANNITPDNFNNPNPNFTINKSLLNQVLKNKGISNKETEDIYKSINDSLNTFNNGLISIDKKNFSFNKEIKSGGFGKVFSYKDNSSDPNEVAVKMIAVKDFSGISEENINKNLLDAINHRLVVGENGHKNIVNMKLFFTNSDNKAIINVMEFANKGDLDKFKSNIKNLDNNEKLLVLKYMLKGTAEGLEYMNNERGMLHRDIKPANILISFDEKNPENPYTPKLCDFGFSQKIGESIVDDVSELPRSEGYFDPGYYLPDVKETTSKQDVFSLGAAFYDIANNKTLSFGETDNIKKCFYTEGVEKLKSLRAFSEDEIKNSTGDDKKLKELINKMTNPDPKQRCTISEVVDSGFFKMSEKEKSEAVKIMQKIYPNEEKKDKVDK